MGTAFVQQPYGWLQTPSYTITTFTYRFSIKFHWGMQFCSIFLSSNQHPPGRPELTTLQWAWCMEPPMKINRVLTCNWWSLSDLNCIHITSFPSPLLVLTCFKGFIQRSEGTGRIFAPAPVSIVMEFPYITLEQGTKIPYELFKPTNQGLVQVQIPWVFFTSGWILLNFVFPQWFLCFTVILFTCNMYLSFVFNCFYDTFL